MTELLTLQEAAARLKVTERSVHRYIRDGKLRAQKTATGRWRIQASDVETFLGGETRTKQQEQAQ